MSEKQTARKVYKLPYGVVVNIMPDGAGSITSELKTGDSSECWSDAMDIVESMLLAHACAGIDIESESYVAGFLSCVNALADKL